MNPSVLVVEDEETMARLLEQALRESGFRVTLARNGAEGIARAADQDALLVDVMMPLMVRGETPEQAVPKAEAMLQEVGLSARAAHLAGELSGGEQQRVAMARALVGRPKYLLADEPTGNLDEETAGQIWDLLERMHREHDLTSVIVTHSPALARRCDRTLRLAKGGLNEVAVTMEKDSHV